MKLTDDQQATLRTWAEDGATLNEIQNRLRDEMEIRITFMDVRFLILDLGITLKPDPVETPKPEPEKLEPTSEDKSSVELSLDEVPMAGAMASGTVIFSDGVLSSWFIDQNGELGLRGADPAYQPPPDDVPAFNDQLKAYLQKLGLY